MSLRTGACRTLLTLLIGLAAITAPTTFATFAATAAPPTTGETRLLRQLDGAVSAGNLIESLALSRELRALNPSQPIYAYNQACLLARLQRPEQALSALQDALRLGYEDYRNLLGDPDLDVLRDTPEFADLAEALQQRLQTRMRQSALWILDGAWSTWLNLTSDDPTATPGYAARFLFSPAGLQLEILAPDTGFEIQTSRGISQGGVDVVLAVPADLETFDTDRAWRFRFGRSDGLPSGWLIQSPERRIETNILELAPGVGDRDESGRSLMRALIGWAYIAPYAPPIDTLYGLNVRISTDPGSQEHHLIPDPSGGGSATSRFVPVTVRVSASAETRFHGRVDNSIVGRDPLKMEFAIWTATAGNAALITEILDTEGKSLVSSGSKGGTVELSPGLNTFQHQADLSALPIGTYGLSSRLALADGTKLDWSTSLLRLDTDWREQQEENLKLLNMFDRPTLRHRLRLIDNHLQRRQPRSSPAALAVTINEISNMVYLAEKTGYIYPAGGSVLTVFSDDETGTGFCSVHLSPGVSDLDQARLVCLPPLDNRTTDGLTPALLEQSEAGSREPDLIVIRPRVFGDPQRRQGLWNECLDWIQQRFPGSEKTLCLEAGGNERPGWRLLDMKTAPANPETGAAFILQSLAGE